MHTFQTHTKLNTGLNNLLLAVDVDNTDRVLIDYAIKIAEKFGSKAWIVHVAAPDPDFVGYGVGPEYIRESRAEDLRNEHRILQKYITEFNERSIVADALLIQGPTVEMLQTEIEKLNIDHLIMGSHKHGFFYDIFVGHTSVRMLKHIDIPVTIIPLPDET